MKDDYIEFKSKYTNGLIIPKKARSFRYYPNYPAFAIYEETLKRWDDLWIADDSKLRATPEFKSAIRKNKLKKYHGN